jgi:hypothetical protein
MSMGPVSWYPIVCTYKRVQYEMYCSYCTTMPRPTEDPAHVDILTWDMEYYFGSGQMKWQRVFLMAIILPSTVFHSMK